MAVKLPRAPSFPLGNADHDVLTVGTINSLFSLNIPVTLGIIARPHNKPTRTN